LCHRQYMQYNRYGLEINPIPRNGKLLNISKTIEIPTPKLYTCIFLFLVLQAVYAIYYIWSQGSSHPHKRETAEYRENVLAPYTWTMHILVSRVKEHQMVHGSWYYVVIHPPITNILKGVEISTFKYSLWKPTLSHWVTCLL
jgi:hypothetical protein